MTTTLYYLLSPDAKAALNKRVEEKIKPFRECFEPKIVTVNGPLGPYERPEWFDDNSWFLIPDGVDQEGWKAMIKQESEQMEYRHKMGISFKPGGQQE